MKSESIKFNLKIFKLDKLQRELRGKSDDEIIKTIVSNHRKALQSKDYYKDADPQICTYPEKPFIFHSYCYNQPKELTYWKQFFPVELTENQDFFAYEFSYVLFIVYLKEIYCVIGGSGNAVIKKYSDAYFGIDLYQHIAKPHEDLSIRVQTRGITGQLSQRVNSYNTRQPIADSILYWEIPKNLKLIMRPDLINGVFEAYNLPKQNALMEVGTYFSIQKRITFDELKQLVLDIHSIRSNKENYQNLSLFSKVSDDQLVGELDSALSNLIIDDVANINLPNSVGGAKNQLIEMVHKSKLEKFYECGTFVLSIVNKPESDKEVLKNNLYYECLSFLNSLIDEVGNRYVISQLIYNLKIKGIPESGPPIYGKFYEYLVAELVLNKRKYFRVDDQWFQLDDNYLDRINNDAIRLYNERKVSSLGLLSWPEGKSEGEYNGDHQEKDSFYNLDRITPSNIELCDILLFREEVLYLIHVKDNFDTTMRSLCNQVVLSAKRLWNDVNGSGDGNYLTSCIESYNIKYSDKILPAQHILDEIKNEKLKVVYVMAYNNRTNKGLTSTEKINKSRSNIAKFCLVQTAEEMRSYKSFDFKILDISEIA